MEEFFREHENQFLEYMELEKKTNSEISSLESRRKRILEYISEKTTMYGKDIYIILEEKNNKIYELNEKIANLKIGMHVNEIREANLSEKEETDFDYKTKLIPIINEKDKLQKEIDELKNDSKQILTGKQHIRSIEEREEEIKENLSIKKKKIQQLIQNKIELKEKVLNEIGKKKVAKGEELKSEIKEIEKVISNITKKEFDDIELNNLKEQTLIRLKGELNEKKQKLNNTIREFDELKHQNIEELRKFEQLNIDLNNGNIEKSLKDYFPETEQMPEEDLDPFSENNCKKQEDFGRFFEEQCNIDKNNEMKNEEQKERVWEKDKNGNFHLVEVEKGKGLLRFLKEKAVTVLNNIKGKFRNIKGNFNESVIDVIEKDAENKEDAFKASLHVDTDQYIIISNDKENEKNKEIEENVK